MSFLLAYDTVSHCQSAVFVVAVNEVGEEISLLDA
jgi:hypothetical protein